MNTTQLTTVRIKPMLEPVAASVLPADAAKRPFVPPQLIKQGQVAAITQGGGFGSDNITPPDP